ncbi:matrix metalloproteinase-21-like [Anneissia japonica]|uniref:matrix metalloproteinase-21-like n=1 Tax=Anneissia japonica TaxID=1529436 RepID=UPI001425799B|nr:matrix metalloproteinase-21-like [Anneissia japonica]XP_033106793.1 matrix metalloproteinase-21-like [Anneissia japonica]XP_033106802.1 matrix metalloproteinase-21-like [Anneissia japonica]XP_033106809.1 matrix metalloproteinase-21-like [Anneissia japonica]
MLARQGLVSNSDMTIHFSSIRNLFFVSHLCLIIISSTSSAQQVRRRRFFQDLRPTYNWDPEQNVVISESRAKKFLQEFGYMKKFDRNSRKWKFTDWKYDGPYPSKKEWHESSDSESFAITEDWDFEVERETVMDPESSENKEEQKLYLEAIAKFQKQNNLPVTGQVDEQTMKMFVRPRCGVPDNLGRFLIKNTSKELEGIAPSKSTPTEKPRFPNLHTILRSSAPNVRQSQKPVDLTTPSSVDMLTTVLTSYADDTGVPSTTTSPEPVRRRRALPRPLSFKDIVKRKKRSQGSNYITPGTPDTIFGKTVITWRIYSNYHSEYLELEAVRHTIKYAFRMWAEVSPLIFVEDTYGDIFDVDVKIAFATGAHLNDNYPFDPYEVEPTQFSHAFIVGDIHFNDNVHFTIDSSHGISLLKTAVHEIGHVLGLPHVNDLQQSVMYPYYTPYDKTNFGLHPSDKHAIQELYGKCDGNFDSVFDWIHMRADGKRVFSTFFFKNSVTWLYEYRYNQTRNGYPLHIDNTWQGIPNNIDAIVQIWSSNNDQVYFFKGTRVIQYDSNAQQAFDIDPATGLAEGDPISEKFPGIPDNLDAAYFDRKDKNIYFFKNSSVYVFDPDTNSVVSDYPKPINQVFLGRSANVPPLENNIDVAYYSFKHRSLYFFKDNRYWRASYQTNTTGQYLRKVGYAENWNLKWNDICEVE